MPPTALAVELLSRGTAANDRTGTDARSGALKLNRNTRLLELLAKGSVVSATTAAQPGSPSIGDVYIIPSTPTGTDWASFTEGRIAVYAESDGALTGSGSPIWYEVTPAEGWQFYARDTNIMLRYSGSAWAQMSVAELLRASATDVVFGRSTAGAGPGEEIAFTAAARALCDDTSARAQCATLSAPHVLAQSHFASSYTGGTGEQALATITIPAGAMGANGSIEVESVWSYTNNANLKTLRVRFGGISGTTYLANNVTTTVSVRDSRRISNRNSQSSQVGGYVVGVLAGGWGGNGNPIVTSAVDTSAAVDIVLTGQLASAGDTVTLEGYTVTVRYRA